MDYTTQEIISHDHEVDSPLQQPPKEPPPETSLTSIGRQSSAVYSFAFNEFQTRTCESSKNIGSINMDEFMKHICSPEEQKAQAHAPKPIEDVEEKEILKQHSLTRKRSIAISVPLTRKTVDEVWAEIHRSKQDQQHNSSTSQMQDNALEADSTQRRPSYGEMTLEDFLVQAGVVREQAHPAPPLKAVPHQQTSASPSLYPIGASNFVPTMPIMGTLGGVGVAVGVNLTPYHPRMQPRLIVGEIPSTHQGAMKRVTGGYPHHLQSTAVSVAVPPPECHGNRGGYAPVTPLAALPPMSPVSSDGLMTNQGDGTSYDGTVMSRLKRKRNIEDGVVEKGVERRQRRMIKNRESAAKSRARKQAYTIELEAELNQMREETTRMKQIIKDMERKMRQKNQQILEMRFLKAQKSKAQRVCGILRMLRRTTSFP